MAYLKAGARIITTASYQASIPGLMNLGFSQAEAEKLIIKSVLLGEEAVKQFTTDHPAKPTPFIAASIGPYGAYLADGSEYRGHYEIDDTELDSFHRRRIQLLDQTCADILACETIPSYNEAKVLSAILKEASKPSWVSFSCKNHQLINDSTKIEKAVAVFEDNPKVIAVGVNCTHPKYITELIQKIKRTVPKKQVVVYPNSGEAYNPETKQWTELADASAFADTAQQWQASGARFIGGCCRIGPEQIKRLSESIYTKLENSNQEPSK